MLCKICEQKIEKRKLLIKKKEDQVLGGKDLGYSAVFFGHLCTVSASLGGQEVETNPGVYLCSLGLLSWVGSLVLPGTSFFIGKQQLFRST